MLPGIPLKLLFINDVHWVKRMQADTNEVMAASVVYLSNVEAICRRFVDEKRDKLVKLLQDTQKWAG